MSTNIHPFARSEQILRALARNGPMSVAGLQAILEPPMKRTKLHAALMRLHKRGLLEQRKDKVFGTAYHYISANPSAVKIISRCIGMSSKDVRLPCFRHAELLHSQICAIWQHRLQRLFPSATVLREHEYSSNAVASNTLISLQSEAEARPDLMVLHPSVSRRGYSAVGVEIERFLKSKARLLEKLDRYATRSLLDGVIYVCSHDSITNTLRTVWNSKVLQKALRVNHYGSNFLLFSDGTWNSSACEPVMHNAALDEASLTEWLNYLTRADISQRRDHLFTKRGSASPP